MITGSHLMLFSRDPEADRTFFAEVLGQPHVDAGGGWLIFKLPPAEVAMHPADGPADGPPGQELYLLCDDVAGTVAELRAKGVEFTQEISDERWGRVTRFRLPGGAEVGLYEPHHPLAIDL
ncbi:MULTISPECIES: VOC family protein [unclassified Nocardioides]|uniref:VOC family protein n=1 Tax=unclassified Nocardioides TaxID=2615069 RepID=UPI0006F994C4|nr:MULTISPECIES: VOC family protein [unclassified Nocardioides]KRA32379.1 extradiol dioxygenase [Nocardioides sp. Root614]KRA89031.1 extradiol dioxygenase [Nocardioides sp. Root682]